MNGIPPQSNILAQLLPFIVTFVILYLLKKLINKKINSVPKKETRIQQEKTLGIILTVIGGAIGLWVIMRVTSIDGMLHSWLPPFVKYEVTTLIGAEIALFLIIVGVIKLTKKQQGGMPPGAS